MNRLNAVIVSVNAFVWGSPMLGLLGMTGVLLTLGLGFMPWRKIGYGFRLLFDRSDAGAPPPSRWAVRARSSTCG